MKINNSYNTERENLGDFLVPSWPSLLFTLLLAGILLLLLNSHALWEVFVSNSAAEAQSLSTVTDDFSRSIDKLGTVVVAIFWLGVGTMAYMIVAFVQNLALTVKDDVDESHYVNGVPGTDVKKSYWKSVSGQFSFLAAAFIATLSCLIIFCGVLLPTLSKIFLVGANELNTGRGLLEVTGSVVATAIGLYVLGRLLRVLQYAWQTTRQPG